METFISSTWFFCRIDQLNYLLALVSQLHALYEDLLAILYNLLVLIPWLLALEIYLRNGKFNHLEVCDY